MNKYIFLLLYVCFFAASLIYQIRAEKKVDSAQRQAGAKYLQWTHHLITITYVTVSFLALIEYFVFFNQGDISLIISLLGVGVFMLGLIGRRISIQTLGQYWSGDIEIKGNHLVVQTGIYSLLRHPNYVSMILKVVGFALVPNAYYTLLFALMVYVPVILIRMFFEERILVAKLGEEYLKYKNEVWAFIPYKRELVSFFGIK